MMMKYKTLLKTLLITTFSFLFSISSNAKTISQRIIPSKSIEISKANFPNISQSTSFRPDFKYFPGQNKIIINAALWASDKQLIKTKVYEGPLFKNCQQEIIKLNAQNAKVLRLNCSGGSRVFIIGNGLIAPSITQAWPLIEGILRKEPKVIIYLTELAGQGLTRLKEQDKQIQGEFIGNIENHFALYKKDMEDTFKLVQNAHPNKKAIGIFLSSSSLSALEAMQAYPSLLEKAIFNGPFLGLSFKDRLRQKIGVFLSFFLNLKEGKFGFRPFADPLKTSWGLCSESLNSSLKELEEAKESINLPALHFLHKLPMAQYGLCELGAGIDNPPRTWTDSANVHYQNIIHNWKPIKTDIVYICGEKDSVSDLGQMKNLTKKTYGHLIILKGKTHNGFINYPEEIFKAAFASKT